MGEAGSSRVHSRAQTRVGVRLRVTASPPVDRPDIRLQAERPGSRRGCQRVSSSILRGQRRHIQVSLHIIRCHFTRARSLRDSIYRVSVT